MQDIVLNMAVEEMNKLQSKAIFRQQQQSTCNYCWFSEVVIWV